MKPIMLIITVALGLLSCNNKLEKQQESQSKKSKSFVDTLSINNIVYQLDSISEFTYNSVRPYNLIKSKSIDTNLIKISKDGIAIVTAGKIVMYKNDTAHNESLEEYRYVDTYPEIGSVHIKATYWEWFRDFLVSLKSGKEIELWGNPIVSPNKKYVISNSADLVACEMPNGIQLFKIVEGGFKKIFEKEIENWEPYEIKWESDTSIVIKIAKLDNSYSRHFSYRRMILKE
jgi:hypothetical protein